MDRTPAEGCRVAGEEAVGVSDHIHPDRGGPKGAAAASGRVVGEGAVRGVQGTCAGEDRAALRCGRVALDPAAFQVEQSKVDGRDRSPFDGGVVIEEAVGEHQGRRPSHAVEADQQPAALTVGPATRDPKPVDLR